MPGHHIVQLLRLQSGAVPVQPVDLNQHAVGLGVGGEYLVEKLRAVVI